MSNLNPKVEIRTVKLNQYLTKHFAAVSTATDPEAVVDAVMTDLCQLLEGVNTQRFGVGVKFFWPNLCKPGTSIVAHVRISSKDTKFQSTSYHIWFVRVSKAETDPQLKEKEDDENDESADAVSHSTGE